MNLTRIGAAARATLVIGFGALALAACSSDPDAAAKAAADSFPDLASQGLASFECGQGEAIGGTFQQPLAPYEAECWKGAPEATFLDVANSAQDAIMLATKGTNVTDQVCRADAFGEGGGIACRAVLVTEGDSSAIVRTVVVLTDPDAVTSALPENPTPQQVNEALAGAELEVLIGTEPTSDGSSPAPSASA